MILAKRKPLRIYSPKNESQRNKVWAWAWNDDLPINWHSLSKTQLETLADNGSLNQRIKAEYRLQLIT